MFIPLTNIFSGNVVAKILLITKKITLNESPCTPLKIYNHKEYTPVCLDGSKKSLVETVKTDLAKVSGLKLNYAKLRQQ